MAITDHAFKPSKRQDSCDFTYWQANGPWLACDYPEAAHAEPCWHGIDPRLCGEWPCYIEEIDAAC